MQAHTCVNGQSVADRPGASRVLGVLAGALLLAGLAAGLAREGLSSWHAVSAHSTVRPEEAVVLVAALFGALVAAWLAAGALVVLWSVLRGSSRSRLVPLTVHVVVAALLGVAVAPAASASDAAGSVASQRVPTSTSDMRPPAPPLPDPGWGATPTATTSDAPARAPATVDPGWLPLAPAPPARVAPPGDPLVLGSPRASATPQGGGEVVVRRGDTLWDLAARHLGADAGDAEIASAWPQWYEANRSTIGDDPDLLLPGQLLRPPP